jgi:hypothetical protein
MGRSVRPHSSWLVFITQPQPSGLGCSWSPQTLPIPIRGHEIAEGSLAPPASHLDIPGGKPALTKPLY